MNITYFKNEWEAYTAPELSIDASWDEIAAMLTTFIPAKRKEDTEMYNLWEFAVKDNLIHRCKDDCIALHGLVLDYDTNLPLVDAVKRFAGMECVIYTTFNHHIGGQDKYRVVLPFTAPMPIAEFNKKRNSMIDTFHGVDKASFSRSQAIFLHSGPNKEHAFTTRMRGAVLDWTAFEDEEIIEYVVKPREATAVDPDFEDAYRIAVLRSLHSCKGFRHMTSLSLVIVLKSCGASFADYCSIVAKCGAKDSCIQDKTKQIETWGKVSDDVRIGREKRDKFIAKHGGKPILMRAIKQTKERLDRKVEYLKEKLEELKGQQDDQATRD